MLEAGADDITALLAAKLLSLLSLKLWVSHGECFTDAALRRRAGLLAELGWQHPAAASRQHRLISVNVSHWRTHRC